LTPLHICQWFSCPKCIIFLAFCFVLPEINTNEVELADPNFDIKNVTIGLKLTSEFLKNMEEHINDNSIPKDFPTFAKSFFIETTGGGFTHAPKSNDTKKSNATQLTTANKSRGGKRKSNGDKQQGQKRTRKGFFDKSLKMGLFHIKKGALAAKALPDKSKLKDGVGVCIDFCSHEKNATSLTNSARMGTTTQTGKMYPLTTRSSSLNIWTAWVLCVSMWRRSKSTKSQCHPNMLTSWATPQDQRQ
jgi:hypothetical protein